MEIVAQHLQQQAIKRREHLERDLFGRSAFNRYYYAMFLDVKTGLGGLRPEWGNEIAHKAVPELLRGTVKTHLQQGSKKALRANDAEVVSLCEKAKSAAESLAKMMDQGRATRVAADYTPDIPVEFSTSADFSLNTVSVEEARQWPYRARGLIAIIASAWKQIHV